MRMPGRFAKPKKMDVDKEEHPKKMLLEDFLRKNPQIDEWINQFTKDGDSTIYLRKNAEDIVNKLNNEDNSSKDKNHKNLLAEAYHDLNVGPERVIERLNKGITKLDRAYRIIRKNKEEFEEFILRNILEENYKIEDYKNEYDALVSIYQEELTEAKALAKEDRSLFSSSKREGD